MNTSLQKIDLCIVCGRRPELLEATLESFSRNIFINYDIESVYANIDPFCGSDVDTKKVECVLKKYFPKCEIFTPDRASFGGAVKRLWGATKGDYVLHIEDDWLAIEKMNPIDLKKSFVGTVTCLSFLTEEKKWEIKNGDFHTRLVKKKILGVTYKKYTVGCFTTSPSFFLGNFARMCSELMLPDLDPEKQFYNGMNNLLESYSENFLNKFIYGSNYKFLIKDIGRNYRDGFGIEKSIIDGVSIWKTK